MTGGEAVALTVPALLAARAAAEPEQVAMVADDGRTLTFREWDERSDAIAGGLLERGVRRGDRVGLLFGERGWIDLAVAGCAAQKAAAVAVPLSDRLPPAVLGDLLARSSVSCLVHAAGLTPPAAGRWTATAEALESAGGRPPDGPRPEDVAQILYTSGTTASPKGVSATHANLTFGLDPLPRHRPLAHSRHFLHAYPVGTNAGQTMLLNALVARPAALVAARFDAERFCDLIESYGVGTVFVVPAMAIELLNRGVAARHDLSSVVLLGSTGAPLPPAVALALTSAFPGATVVNYYTSTEAAPAQTTMVFDPERPASVGRPDRGHDLLIAGGDGGRLGPGQVGEVWLRSPAPARAYDGDPRASAEVFRQGWVRMGDLGYLDDDGYLHLVDRESDVVKSGGFKISTLAVEAALYEHPAVADAAAVGLPHPVMGAMVAAAIVPRAPVTADELRAFLRSRLSQSELPTRLALLDALPRNDAGKVLKSELRAALAAPEAGAGAAPGSPAEATLSGIWQRVLGTRTAGPDDDFFALGGDSLRASQLAELAAEAFGVAVPTSLAFDLPVLAGQAAWLDARAGVGGDAAEPPAAAGDDCAAVPLSSQQESFFFWMHETDPPRDAGFIRVVLRIKDHLAVPVLERSLRELVRRHDSLRMLFGARGGRPEAFVRADLDPEVIAAPAADEADAVRQIRQLHARPVDLARGPLVRALVLHLGPDHHVLYLAVHHMAFDGWSMGVMLRELGLVYSAFRTGQPSPLPPVAMRCADFIAWTRRQWPRTRAFWQRTLEGAPPAVVPFPGRAVAHRFTRAFLGVPIDARMTERLQAAARTGAATPFMVVAACWTAVLSAWSGTTDIVIMTPVPGRTRPEAEGLIGCLVMSILLRVDAGGDPPFEELLARVRTTALDALDHQYYPYDEFRPRCPEAPWIRYESWGGPPHLPGLESEPFEVPRELADEDWEMPDGDVSVPELSVLEQPDGSLAVSLVYNRHTFERPTVERLAEMLVRCCRRAVERPTLRLSELTR